MHLTYAQAAQAFAAGGVAPADPMTAPIEQARQQQDRYFAEFNRDLPALAGIEDLLIAGPHGDLPLRLHYPVKSSAELPVIVFVRGAGWWAGSLDSHARTMHSLALLTGCVVCGVDYRRTPEYQFPVQRDELLTAIDWLQTEGPSHGLQAAPPVLFGESAGATLCLTAAMTLRDQGRPAPAGLVLFYTNAGGPKPSARAYSQWVWQQYLGHKGASTDGSAVPLLGDFSGLPPMWLGTGEDDPLMADTLSLERAVRAAGQTPQLETYPGLPHGFVMWTGLLTPALQALEQASAATRQFFGSRLVT
jgi:acetyl esterase